ncbi:MAG TPA: hypothetical protein VLL82_01205 [Mycobacterium sp.]|nr:hypothetical protein [Mycobacterium sp.]
MTAFLRRWLLVTDARAWQMLRFLPRGCDVPTPEHLEGFRLLPGWLDDRLGGVDLTERFGRLLDQPLISSALPAD